MSTKIPHLITLADVPTAQLTRLLSHAHALKQTSTPWLLPHGQRSPPKSNAKGAKSQSKPKSLRLPPQTLFSKSIALLFAKRSTRTRVAAETSTALLGGRALFLGRDDIQLGVNESARDTARIVGGMCQGIFARVGGNEEIEELVRHSPVPVLNALSSMWHPTQILADLLTLHEHATDFAPEPTDPFAAAPAEKNKTSSLGSKRNVLPSLRPLTIAYVGDPNNILNDMLVSYPRLGHRIRIGAPAKYAEPYFSDAASEQAEVMKRVEALGCNGDGMLTWTSDPREAVKGADVVVTDTWISMGQEDEKAQRLADFAGYQVTEELCAEGGASPNWKFMHCLPRKPQEVNDEVFFGPRSLVYPEADNRKWTIMALFDQLFGRWQLDTSVTTVLGEDGEVKEAAEEETQE
ncbi:ornithine carbamoyltransferase 1 [Schizophyllum amplum]|uniref:ornithine carbamoyltransferase n=1 Tax=Schizophyllum amplum TaxID=97359 RepID=A0A550CPA1_9AGAR|nr:ornithine carbamoyltransferase 1 [Auriculariopsis ampla]